MRKRLFVGALMASIATAGHAQIVNGGFENSTTSPGGVYNAPAGSNAVTGWTIGGGGVDVVTPPTWGGSQGSNTSLDMSLLSAGSISQVVNLAASTRYRLSFDVGASPEPTPATKSLGVSVRSQGFLSLPASTTVTSVASGVASQVNWQTHDLEFTAGFGGTNVTFQSLTNTPYGPTLDNVRVVPIGMVTRNFLFTGLNTGLQVGFKAPEVLPPPPAPERPRIRIPATIVNVAPPGRPIQPPDPRAQTFWKVTTFILTFGLKKGIKATVPGAGTSYGFAPDEIATFEGDNLDALYTDRANPVWNDNPFYFNGTFTDTDGTVTTDTFLATSTTQVDALDVFAASVPEPSSWAMLIAGFGLTGAAMRRRRTQAVLA